MVEIDAKFFEAEQMCTEPRIETAQTIVGQIQLLDPTQKGDMGLQLDD